MIPNLTTTTCAAHILQLGLEGSTTQLRRPRLRWWLWMSSEHPGCSYRGGLTGVAWCVVFLCSRFEITEINISLPTWKLLNVLYFGAKQPSKRRPFHSNQNRGHQRVPGTHMSNCSSSLWFNFFTFKFFVFRNMFFFFSPACFRKALILKQQLWRLGFHSNSGLNVEPRSRKEPDASSQLMEYVDVFFSKWATFKTLVGWCWLLYHIGGYTTQLYRDLY